MDIRFINVEHSIKFRNLHEAQKEANRLKMTMDRFAKKTKIPFTCVFAVSELSLKFGEYVFFHNGKKGRPKRQLVSKLKPFQHPETVMPHLHIIIAYTEKEKVDILNKLEGKKYKIQRSKGLGENEPDMMWQTTMNPETRRLILVMPEEVEKTALMFDLLLGDNLSGRKEHIETDGYKYIDLTELS